MAALLVSYLFSKNPKHAKISGFITLGVLGAFIYYFGTQLLIAKTANGIGYIEPFAPYFDINIFELAGLVVGLFFVAMYLIPRLSHKRIFLVILPFIAILFAVSLEKSSQVFPIDEINLTVTEIASLPKLSNMGVWGVGVFRVSYATVGVLLSVFDFTKMDAYSVFSYAKILHWLGGILLLLVIFHLLSKYILRDISERGFAVSFSAFMLVSMLLPMNLLGFRVANYDLYAVLLATISLILLVVSYERTNLKIAFFAFVVSVLATSEKLIAGPFLLASLVLLAHLVYLKTKKIYLIPFTIAGCLVVGFLLSFLLTLFVCVARDMRFNKLDLYNVGYPIVSWGWPLVSTKLGHPSPRFLAYFPQLLAGLVICASIISYVLTQLRTKLDAFVQFVSPKLFLLLVTITLIFGVWGTFGVKAYERRYVMPPAGTFDSYTAQDSPYIGVNRWYSGAANPTSHSLRHVAFYYAVFLNAIPSLIWIWLVLAFLYSPKKQMGSILELCAGAMLLIPLGYSITSTWLLNRYYDLYLYIFCLFVLIKLLQVLAPKLSAKSAILFVLASFVLLLAEVAPFAPLYAAFRPVWVEQNKEYQTTFEPGRMDISWMGWGEEMMIAGRKIFAQCAKDHTCSKIGIYTNSKGAWIYKNANRYTYDIFKNIYVGSDVLPTAEKPEMYTANDYFIMVRGALNDTHPKPSKDIPVEFTISYRGYVVAWVYKGDVLATNGYFFKEITP